MAQRETRRGQTEKSSLFNISPEDVAGAQTELFDQIQEINRHWLDRIEAEVSLASELASKLTAARSIPDAMTAYQEWGSRRFEMMANDTKHFLDDTQKFVRVGAHFLASRWQPKHSGATASPAADPA